MDFSNFIGFPLEYVMAELEKAKIEYNIIKNSEIQKNSDTILVVKINKINNNLVEIITDNFLLNI